MARSVTDKFRFTGSGYLLFYKFPPALVKKQANIPDYLEDRFAGGIGCVAIANYTDSDVGAFQELLFIPGTFNLRNKKSGSITIGYVSKSAAIENSMQNWAVNKQTADFVFQKRSSSVEEITVGIGGESIFNIRLKTSGLFSFNVNQTIIPYNFLHKRELTYFYTAIQAKGKAKKAKVERVSSSPDYFPDLSGLKPIKAVKLEKFIYLAPPARMDKSHR